MMERTAERSAALADELRDVVVRAEALLQAIVRENPWTVIGGAVATGLVLGAAFTGRLRSRDGVGG